MYRIRIRFCRGPELKFISHLDIMRMWHRVFQRAGIPLAYSEGFNPQPRVALAAPLAIGITSEAELMDVFCAKWVSPHYLVEAVSSQLPQGIKILQALPVPLTQPSLQAMIRFAHYRVEVVTDENEEQLQQSLDSMLALEHLPWQHQRDTGTRNYDLRPLVDELFLAGCEQGKATIEMCLRCDSGGSGRPEQVVKALGLEERPCAIHRTRLTLKAG